MFRKLFFGKNDSSKDAFDLSLGYSRLQEFKDYLINRNFEIFEDTYESLNWDEKTLLNDGIGLNENLSEEVFNWVNQRPDSYVANLFAACMQTRLAWIARTAGLGINVSEKRAIKFAEYLESAFDFLKKADEINDADAEVCARMVRVCMGLGLENDVTESYFNAAVEIEPNHLMVHLFMINYLSPKWYGSIEEMHSFADNCMQKSNCTLLIVLKLFAIVEEWVYYDMINEKEKKKQFFADASTKKMVYDLYDKYYSPKEGTLMEPYVFNYFAFLFYMFNEKSLAHKLIEGIAQKGIIYPWTYIGVNDNLQLQNLIRQS